MNSLVTISAVPTALCSFCDELFQSPVQIANCRLLIAHCRLQTAHCPLNYSKSCLLTVPPAFRLRSERDPCAERSRSIRCASTCSLLPVPCSKIPFSLPCSLFGIRYSFLFSGYFSRRPCPTFAAFISIKPFLT